MNYKALLTSVLMFLIFRSGTSQVSTETRTYMKTFSVGKNTSLEVTNKYGTIEITSWNKDSAYIRAEVKAYSPNQEKLATMFDGISINITGVGPILRAQTDFAQNFSRLFEGFKGMTSKIVSYDSRIEINYYINVPEYLSLKIGNKYGDVYMEDCSGKLSVSVSNGSFKANNLGSESDIILSFCDASIGSILEGTINSSFSEITVSRTGNISVASASSKFHIGNAGEIRFESRRDKFFIDSIESVTGTSYFTDYSIESLSKEISLITKYGAFTAEKIEMGFDAINLNAGNSDIVLNFDENASFNLDIRHINTFLTLPAKNIKTELKILNEEKKEYITYGTVGNNPGSTKVKLDATRGKIFIK